MPNVTAGYIRFSDLVVFLRIFILWVSYVYSNMYYYMFETLVLRQIYTNYVLRQKCRDKKLTYVIIYVNVNLIFFMKFLWWKANERSHVSWMNQHYLYNTLTNASVSVCFCYSNVVNVDFGVRSKNLLFQKIYPYRALNRYKVW